MKHKILKFSLIFIAAMACKSGEKRADATGTFEADEILISAEASGTLLQWNIAEGQTISAGRLAGIVDTVQLQLKKLQMQAQVGAVLSKRPDIQSQIAVIQAQLGVAEREQWRIANLVKAEAATQRQLDDINAQILVLGSQLNAQQTALKNTSNGITEETNPIAIQIMQINDQIRRCHIINPISGVILNTYVHSFEVVAPGKPLYKIADMSEMTLRAYVTGDQFDKIRLGQKVVVMVDSDKKALKKYNGVVNWISDKAEFTPKTIQTKDERANLVYAVKIKVPNDGLLKIGMYGEVNF
jgi:HlyD family secretion protein